MPATASLTKEPVMTAKLERHRPVMVSRALEFLLPPDGPGRNGIIVDATVGYGGHAEAILETGGDDLCLVGIDRDEEALGFTHRRLRRFGDRVILIKENFSHLPKALGKAGVDRMDGVLFDLGMSSPQVDEGERGFGWTHPGPLDMRMDREQETTAATLVNRLSASELEEILQDFAEERFAKQIARHIVSVRRKSPIETTAELAATVAAAIPSRFWPRHRHPATRTFQALRIAVNNELEILPNALETAVEHLSSGARIVVLTYHSLEDRIAKQSFRRLSTGIDDAARTPFGEPTGRRILNLLTKRPLKPCEAEVRSNPRARSAHLRAAERGIDP